MEDMSFFLGSFDIYLGIFRSLIYVKAGYLKPVYV